jgi:hypothetical protein
MASIEFDHGKVALKIALEHLLMGGGNRARAFQHKRPLFGKENLGMRAALGGTGARESLDCCKQVQLMRGIVRSFETSRKSFTST